MGTRDGLELVRKHHIQRTSQVKIYDESPNHLLTHFQPEIRRNELFQLDQEPLFAVHSEALSARLGSQRAIVFGGSLTLMGL